MSSSGGQHGGAMQENPSLEKERMSGEPAKEVFDGAVEGPRLLGRDPESRGQPSVRVLETRHPVDSREVSVIGTVIDVERVAPATRVDLLKEGRLHAESADLDSRSRRARSG